MIKFLQRFLRLARSNPEGRAVIEARRIYILPTRYGVGYGVLLMLMLLGSINYANNLGFMLTFLLAGLGLVTMLHTWYNLLGLEILPGRTEPAFAGESALFAVRLNNQRSAQRPGIQLQLPDAAPVSLDLPAAAETEVALSVPTPQRGRFSLPRFSISTRYPLGLLRAWAYVEMDLQCLVYPAPGAAAPAIDAPDYRPSSKGDKGVGADDFIGLRHYRPGDSPKHLNWKALAREQGLQTKLFGGDRAERRWLDWACTRGNTETRLSLLCRGVLDASDQQLEFGLRLPGEEIAPAMGQIQRSRCLERLALFRAAP